MKPNTPPSPTAIVAKRLVELCSTGKYQEAMKELYADDARHVEAMAMPGSERIIEGKANLLKKGEHFAKTTTVHGASCGQPVINGDQFICEMKLDCTSSEGPMAGQRMEMAEQCLYTVKNGKISEAKFFYGGC